MADNNTKTLWYNDRYNELTYNARVTSGSDFQRNSSSEACFFHLVSTLNKQLTRSKILATKRTWHRPSSFLLQQNCAAFSNSFVRHFAFSNNDYFWSLKNNGYLSPRAMIVPSSQRPRCFLDYSSIFVQI